MSPPAAASVRSDLFESGVSGARTSSECEVWDMRLAYVDPGSGSLMLQAVLAGFAGIAVTLRLTWRRITNRFRRQPDNES